MKGHFRRTLHPAATLILLCLLDCSAGLRMILRRTAGRLLGENGGEQAAIGIHVFADEVEEPPSGILEVPKRLVRRTAPARAAAAGALRCHAQAHLQQGDPLCGDGGCLGPTSWSRQRRCSCTRQLRQVARGSHDRGGWCQQRVAEGLPGSTQLTLLLPIVAGNHSTEEGRLHGGHRVHLHTPHLLRKTHQRTRDALQPWQGLVLQKLEQEVHQSHPSGLPSFLSIRSTCRCQFAALIGLTGLEEVDGKSILVQGLPRSFQVCNCTLWQPWRGEWLAASRRRGRRRIGIGCQCSFQQATQELSTVVQLGGEHLRLWAHP
mmetsp:Transcript_30708/g.71760  ORF Transcript_30708/g.71760 Transcript_30708/m.71760 type:complete len:319 (+) Transcript_30708:429-1385(+)